MLRSAHTSTAAERYLDALAERAPAGTLLDVRYRIRGHGLRRFFVGMHASGRPALIARIGHRTDVYVGVAPRTRRSGGRADVAATTFLWADCDTPESVDALDAFALEPTMVVATGSGQNVHSYWALAEPLGVEALEDLNRRFAALLGADGGAVTNAAAVLRVPDTLSFKHNPPRPVALRRLACRRYAPAEIDAALPPSPEPAAPPHAALPRDQPDGEDPLLHISPREYVPALTGRKVARDGKLTCPFHDDATPSLHAYRDPRRGWCCFGCTGPAGGPLGGDIYTLASLMWGIPARGAHFFELRRRLDELFGIRRD